MFCLFQLFNFAVGPSERAVKHVYDLFKIFCLQDVLYLLERKVHASKRAHGVYAHDIVRGIVSVARPFVCFGREDESRSVVVAQSLRRSFAQLCGLFYRIKIFHKIP